MSLIDGRYEVIAEQPLGGGCTQFRATAPDGTPLRIEWFDLPEGREGEFEAAVSVFELTYAGRPARLAIVADLSARLKVEAESDQRRVLEQRADYLTYNDPVTDLPNRQRFEALLLDAMADARASGTRVAVLYLELHGFRLIHDAISQDAADDMLRLAARRLKTISHGSTVARFGTDEFAILTRPLHSAIEATDIAQRVVGVLVEPLTLEGRSVTFRPRVGVAVFPDHADKPGDLMKAASQAKFRAKASRGPAFAVFRPAMRVRAAERLALEGELRRALGAGQLVIYYQPRLDLRDASLAGVEALVRWRHPERGLLSPDSFVPLAEETGLIGALGQEVLERALEQLRLWQEGGFVVPRVAVNLSPLELRGGGLVDRVKTALNRARLPANRLELEVTETAALVDRNRGSELLAELRSVGVTIALDDEEVRRVVGSMFQERDRFKYMDFPSAVYAMHPYDRVLVNGKPAGISTWISYTANEGKFLTLAILDPEHATPGTKVSLVWGEANGGSAKPTVERHVQTEIRGTVAPVPYVREVRQHYADGGWRAKAAAS